MNQTDISIDRPRAKPWYREPWPWFLMSGPAAVIVAGLITSAIAWRTSDPLVVDDYYKEGMAINQTLKRDERAHALGVAATVSINPGRDRLRLVLSGRGPQPDALRLLLLHPTLAGYDQSIALFRVSENVYEAVLVPPRPGLWHMQVEDFKDAWRLTGNWHTRDAVITLGDEPVKEEK
jgi:hypothetical protein